MPTGQKSYEDGMAYYGQLKKEGKLDDMTMAEFADYYRQKKTLTEPECALPMSEFLYFLPAKNVLSFCTDTDLPLLPYRSVSHF